jgi:hypothetical protein
MSGVASSASISGFSKYVTSARGPFLNGTTRTCPHHSTHSGACNPMNRASAWIAAKRWLRVAMAHPRFSSNSFRNCWTRSADTSVTARRSIGLRARRAIAGSKSCKASR